MEKGNNYYLLLKMKKLFEIDWEGGFSFTILTRQKFDLPWEISFWIPPKNRRRFGYFKHYYDAVNYYCLDFYYFKFSWE